MYENKLVTISRAAAASFAASQFYACVFTNNNGIAQAAVQTTAGARVDGIIEDDNPQAGTASTIGVLGVTPAAVGAAVTAGDALEVDATGRLITATGTAGHIPCAVALESATAAGQIIPVLLRPQA